MTPALETHALSKRFGGLTATSGVDFVLETGARHALIGPNGAGKTTFVNLLTGVLKPSTGQVVLFGEDVTGAEPATRVRRGLARTFQINQLFGGLSPRESLALAVSEREGLGWTWRKPLGAHATVASEVDELARRFNLADKLDAPTRTLAYGKQRQLEIALACACRPKVLLLDEPAAGVPEVERKELLATIAALPAEVAVLLIEHDMDIVFSFARKISVLVGGALFREGAPAEIAKDPAVRAVYLGEDGHG